MPYFRAGRLILFLFSLRQVFYEYGKDSFAKLKAAGADIDFKTYSRMGHSAVPEELKAVLEFIASKIPA